MSYNPCLCGRSNQAQASVYGQSLLKIDVRTPLSELLVANRAYLWSLRSAASSTLCISEVRTLCSVLLKFCFAQTDVANVVAFH